MGVSAGLCRAALPALKTQSKGIPEKVHCILVLVLESLSSKFVPAAMAVLVGGSAIEATVLHMVEDGLDVQGYGLRLLLLFMENPVSQNRMFAPRLVDQLLKGITKWLLQVRDFSV
jgi:hypothetical protein